MKTVEEDLGILLFKPHARGIRLTQAGRLFVEQVAVGVDQLDHAVKTAGMAALTGPLATSICRRSSIPVRRPPRAEDEDNERSRHDRIAETVALQRMAARASQNAPSRL